MARRKRNETPEEVEKVIDIEESIEEVETAPEEVLETPEEVETVIDIEESIEEVETVPEEVLETPKWEGVLKTLNLSLAITKIIKLKGEDKTELLINSHSPNTFCHCVLTNEVVTEIVNQFKLSNDSYFHEIYNNYGEDFLLNTLHNKGVIINRMNYNQVKDLLK